MGRTARKPRAPAPPRPASDPDPFPAMDSQPQSQHKSAGFKPGVHLPLNAVAAVVAPALVVLIGLAALDRLAWLYASSGAGFVVLASGFFLYRHFARVEGLRRYVEELGRSGAENRPKPPREGSPILSPGLEAAIQAAAEERLRRRRELEAVLIGNEAILATLPDPLIMLDSARRLVRANPAAIELFEGDLAGGDLAGRDLTGVLRSPSLLSAADEVLEGADGRVVDFTVPGPVQRTFNARIARLPAPTLDGTVAILSLHDLTSIKRAEQLRADFVANASHELRTPLSSLLGFVETLRGPAKEDSGARDRFLAIMEEQATRMSRLVEDLLSLSRIEMQEHTPPTGVTDVDRVVRMVAGALEMPVREKDMTVRVEIGAVPPVVGDPDELAQVFQNLMENAIKYGRAGTEVTVTGAPSDLARRRLGRKALAISVIDRGEGIAREHLPRLTERFYRVDTARSRKLGGTGLGLAIVKHIVNRHRGALEIESVEGEGSTFTVYLPEAEAAAQPKAPRAAQ